MLLDTIPVELLMIAGAGNGGGDARYSGTPGQNAILDEGTNEGYKTASFSGGGFNAANSGNTSGMSLLSGAAASQYVYTRGGLNSKAGFGGGGGNTDDGTGSGGGGYRGGVRGGTAGSSYNIGDDPVAILNTDRTDGSVDIIQLIVYKKLVLNNEDGNYYYYDGTAWQSIGATLTYAEFGDYGMERIEYATLSYFTDYKILAFTSDEADTDITTIISQKPPIQKAERVVSIDLSTKVLTSAHLVATSEVRVLVSANDDETWQAFTTDWEVIDTTDLSVAYNSAMTVAVFNGLYKTVWARLSLVNLRLMFLIDTDDIDHAVKVSGLTFSYMQKEA
jgi:hypothetical protein